MRTQPDPQGLASRDLSVVPSGALGRLVASRWSWALLLGLGLVARLPRLGESLWYDEVYYSTHHHFSTWATLTGSLASSVAAPLYRLLLFAWVAALGEHELIVRLPSLLFGLGSIAVTGALLHHRAGPPFAWLVGAWLCLSPVHVWYSQEAAPYALLLFLVVTAVWLGARLARRSALDGWVLLGYAAVLTSAVFTHYYAVLSLLPLSLEALGAPRRTRRWMLGVHALIAISLAAVIGLKLARGQLATGMDFLRPFTLLEAWLLHVQWLAHGNCLALLDPYATTWSALLARPGLLLLQLAVAALLLRGARLSLRRGADPRERVLVAHVAVYPVALLALTWLGLGQLYVERYLLVVLPFFAALLLRGAWGLASPWLGRVVAVSALALSLAAYVGWWRAGAQWTVYKPNPDWRTAAARILETSSPQGTAVVLAVTPTHALEFYLQQQARTAAPPIIDASRFDFERASSHGVRVLYVVHNRYWSGEFETVRRWMDAQVWLVQDVHLQASGVEILRYTLR